MASIDLPPKLRAWVEDVSGLQVGRARPHFAGVSRDAWQVDVGGRDSGRELFLLSDRGRSQGSQQDATVLRALASTPIPVPAVVGYDESLGALLLERIPGRSDFPAVDDESEREPTARHLMELTGRLHLIEPSKLRIEDLVIPETAEACALGQLDPMERTAGALGDSADPLFAWAQGWLRRNLPSEIVRVSLVHSDMGPGNFLYRGGRVTAIVDWEVAHFGDPMEDLAAIAIRDMATPMGHLPTRLREYRKSSGIEVDPRRIDFYRALVLIRNAMLIGVGLVDPAPTADLAEMTMFQTLLMRAAALVMCDNLEVERPVLEPVEAESTRGGYDRRWFAAMQRDLEETIVPALEDGHARRRASGLGRMLSTIEHADGVGPALTRAELDDLEELLGARPVDLDAADEALRGLVAEPDAPTRSADARLASYFARRMMRLAERRRPLMGELMDRLPQPLENA